MSTKQKIIIISIHAPTRGATSVDFIKHAKISHFNPRSHERSDFISLFHSLGNYYFNPRSHERSDLATQKLPLPHRYFNPRSHERSDKAQNYLKRYYIISIHAPTRGATSASPSQSNDIRLFQSTLPREERQSNLTLCSFCLHFNPRSHERSDDVIISAAVISAISIHAPTRGATRKRDPAFVIFQKFQSTLPREERPIASATRLIISYFNPRSHERSDRKTEKRCY